QPMNNQNIDDQVLATMAPLGEYAGFATRLVAFLIDRLIIFGFTTVTTLVANFLLNSFQLGDEGVWQYSQLVLNVIVLIVNICFYWGYFLVFWVLSGQTPGKAWMGVRIVCTDGERINIGRAFIRVIGYWISSILFLGYLWVLVDSHRQGFHDKLARTYVVYSWSEEPQPEQQYGMG
ncbi:MAG: RDD family protein, partial [Anaerolineales bacterium]